MRALPGTILAATSLALGLHAETLSWGAREEHPAVVNPVMGNDPANVISLRGEWEFVARPMNRPLRNGVWGRFYQETNWPGSRAISVPGCWEAQGVGEPGMGECWVPKWDNNAKPIRHKYIGDGWYRKTVTVPAAWKGRRIWLKIGGVKSCGWFWVNDRQVALVDNYCGTYKYEITDLVTPGSNATVVAQVNNVRPSRKGLMSAMHRWGGIYRDVEIEATPQTFIDDAWVRGLFDEKAAEVNVEIGGLGSPSAREDTRPPDAAVSSKPPYQIRVTIDGQTVSQPLKPFKPLKLPLRNFRPWSPEHPNLYTAQVDLVENGQVIHVRRERFGVRKFEVRGTEFFLNGKPFYVRGFGDDHVYPLSGITPADRDVHRAHLGKARAAGFNFVRLHTHCELPEYFEAADELGVMIQPELPYYSDVAAEDFSFDPGRDVTELWRNYRRHPSFAVYSMGNEGSFGPGLDAALHRYVKTMDPDRLKINQDSNQGFINPPDAADYCGGPIKEWPRGSVRPDRPFVTHEYLNLCIKLDARSEGDYTGVWLPPATREARAAWLAKAGLDAAWGDRLQDAQHALQRHYQKVGVEWARKDPYCDGYSFWTIVDVVVEQGESYTAQGLFDPFWRQKRGGFSAEEFAVFNSPSCILLDAPDENRVFTSGESLAVDFLFAHYGEAALQDAALEWNLELGGRLSPAADTVREDTRPPVRGRVSVGDIPLGPVRKIASQKIVFPSVKKPVKAKLSARVGSVSNSWDFWVFPPRARRDGRDLAVAPSLSSSIGRLYGGFAVLGTPEASGAKVVVAEAGSPEAEKAIAEGRRVVAIGEAKRVPNVRLGWWWMGTQVGTAILDHPVFAGLPHEGHMSPLVFRIVGEGLPLRGAGREGKDLLMVGEGGQDCFAYVALRRGGGGLAVESFGLDLVSGKPEGTAILDGMIDFTRSH